MQTKTCYIINFYLGDRRKSIAEYDTDKLCLLKKQIETLYLYPHSLSQIIFNFNIRKEDYHYISEIFSITPKFIQGTPIEVNIRENHGISYGAWSDIFGKYKFKYDYYVFNEDDYFFIEPNWDTYLIKKYNSYPDCGFLCPMVREANKWNQFRKHAGHSVGIASTDNLLKVWNLYGKLPHSSNKDYKTSEEIQKQFSFAFLEAGLNIYDIRDDYRVAFGWTEDDGKDIWRIWWWNEKDLIQPAYLLFNDFYHWFVSWDGEFDQSHTQTTLKEALNSYNNKITYYGES